MKRISQLKKGITNVNSEVYQLAHKEEQLILRILDEQLAELLRNKIGNNEQPDLEIIFKVVGDVDPSILDRMEHNLLWPDGLTNPLKDVRRRRFRKRMAKKVIEDIEKEVRRLLEEDSKAISEHSQDMDVDNKEVDISSEFRTQNDNASEKGEVDVDDEENYRSESAASDLAAEIEFGLLQELEDDEDDRQEFMMMTQAIDEIKNEIADIESKIAEKTQQLQKANNIVLKKRFQEALDKLQTSLQEKQANLIEMEKDMNQDVDDTGM
ncbi:hypothetical protein ROZALSC1DRAFT_29461 [Rozella allomycis CSF55]|uniref:TAFII55 protein conserved region domain-containing protein n=1 Tax=Rozella allomycis (strain CSF55) TaxID=988480 RepID=A0A4P9YH69_ROZAC|nr:hypothetical protein ROZALSC1DRAFT_29461 [Rozella allomycis CSF55]